MRLCYRGNDVYLAEGMHIVGRDATCAVVLDSQRTSRRHARIAVEHDLVTIEDLDSVNGVHVNGRRIRRGPQRLEASDRIVLGDAELEVAETDAVPSSSTGEHRTRRSARAIFVRDPDGNVVELNQPPR